MPTSNATADASLTISGSWQSTKQHRVSTLDRQRPTSNSRLQLPGRGPSRMCTTQVIDESMSMDWGIVGTLTLRRKRLDRFPCRQSAHRRNASIFDSWRLRLSSASKPKAKKVYPTDDYASYCFVSPGCAAVAAVHSAA